MQRSSDHPDLGPGARQETVSTLLGARKTTVPTSAAADGADKVTSMQERL